MTLTNIIVVLKFIIKVVPSSGILMKQSEDSSQNEFNLFAFVNNFTCIALSIKYLTQNIKTAVFINRLQSISQYQITQIVHHQNTVCASKFYYCIVFTVIYYKNLKKKNYYALNIRLKRVHHSTNHQ